MTGGVHGQFPDLPPVYTGLVGWGPGFRSGVTVPLIDLQDVAPLVAALLGVEFEEIEGRVPAGLLEEGF